MHNSLVRTNSATFMPPESRRALPAIIFFVEDENQSVVSSGSAFAVPASSPLDELVAPYELRAGSFLSNGSRRLWDIEQWRSVWFQDVERLARGTYCDSFLLSQRQGHLTFLCLHDKRLMREGDSSFYRTTSIRKMA
jgi:hypothetical protein